MSVQDDHVQKLWYAEQGYTICMENLNLTESGYVYLIPVRE